MPRAPAGRSPRSTASRPRRAPRRARSRPCPSPRGGRPAGPRVRLALGRALEAAGGSRKRAIAELVAAEDDLARLGAEHWRAQAARDLRRLGHRVAARPRAGADEGVEGLTERELAVARLVHDRHTNKEIAG